MERVEGGSWKYFAVIYPGSDPLMIQAAPGAAHPSFFIKEQLAGKIAVIFAGQAGEVVREQLLPGLTFSFSSQMPDFPVVKLDPGDKWPVEWVHPVTKKVEEIRFHQAELPQMKDLVCPVCDVRFHPLLIAAHDLLCHADSNRAGYRPAYCSAFNIAIRIAITSSEIPSWAVETLELIAKRFEKERMRLEMGQLRGWLRPQEPHLN